MYIHRRNAFQNHRGPSYRRQVEIVEEKSSMEIELELQAAKT